MDAYEVRLWATCDAPLLPSVEEAYILTMHDSSRLRRQAAHDLQRLARRTYVQINAGFKTGLKEAAVDGPSRDIVHAYKHACGECLQEGHVLILEDDATFMPGATAEHFAEVDAFLRTALFDTYSLGSFGPFLTLGRHRRFMCLVGHAQAVVYSPLARERIRAVDVAAVKHIDAHVISKMARNFTYRRPLVVQHIVPTDNIEEWGCNRHRHTRCERWWVRVWVRMMSGGLRLDRELWGWHVLYAINVATCVFLWSVPVLCAAALVAATVAGHQSA